MYKALILFLYTLATCSCAQSREYTQQNGGSMTSFHPPTTTVSKQQLEYYVTLFIDGIDVDVEDGRSVVTVDATVVNNTELTLHFLSNSKDRCFLLVESLPDIGAGKPGTVSTHPMTVAIKAHSSMKAQGSIELDNSKVKNIKSLRIRVLQTTETFLRLGITSHGSLDFSPYDEKTKK